MRRYIDIYSIMLRNSLIREMSFKANFILRMLVEVLWFVGQIVFFSIIFGQVDRIGNWTKWKSCSWSALTKSSPSFFRRSFSSMGAVTAGERIT